MNKTLIVRFEPIIGRAIVYNCKSKQIYNIGKLEYKILKDEQNPKYLTVIKKLGVN